MNTLDNEKLEPNQESLQTEKLVKDIEFAEKFLTFVMATLILFFSSVPYLLVIKSI